MSHNYVVPIFVVWKAEGVAPRHISLASSTGKGTPVPSFGAASLRLLPDRSNRALHPPEVQVLGYNTRGLRGLWRGHRGR